jgi:hypothetical protein
MKYASRLCATAGVAGVAALSCLVCRDAARETGLDFWRLPEWRRQAEDGLRRGEELEAQLAAVRQCYAAKRQALAEVVAERLTLREAAARFRQADLVNPIFPWDAFPDLYPGDTDGERHCREVIHHVRLELRDEPARAAAVVARLEGELQGYLASFRVEPEVCHRAE